ncbi:hypothetical protein IWW49_004211 [Coemansia sp. RSA 1797]|nr:hypothetical protein IWW49_004211 [Coemansia sp. RSA 1797]
MNGPSGASTSSAACTSDAGSLLIRASRSSSNLLVGDTLEQPLSPLVTPANEKPLTSAASYTASASDTTLRIGGFITVDRKQLPEARVQSYEVEVNGRIVGKCGREDETTRIQGLLPLMTYQIRVWAISNSRGRTPSAPVFVKTLTSREALAQDSRALGQSSLSGSEPVSVDGLHRETIDLQRETGEMEDAMSDLKDQTDLECGKLQVKVSELRATRKEDESARAVQRSRLRELEAEKRWLEKEKSELVSKIAESAARKQRALDRRRDKAKKAEEYRRMTDLIYEKMERERCDYENEQSELVATIDALKLEVDKANQHMHELLQEQADVASQLQSRRAELTAQDEENAELDSKIKTAIHKQRQIKAGQKEAAMTIAKLQTEVDSLKFQLDEAVSQRQQFEILAAEAQQSLPYTAATVARPPPIHPASYGLSAAKQHSMVGSGSTHSTVFSQSSLPARIRNVEYPVIGNYDNGLSNNHTRSLSSIGILQCASIAENPLPLAHSLCPDQSSSGKHSVNSANAFLSGTRTGYSGASLRDSTDIRDLLSGWSSSVPKLTTELSSASGYIHPLHFGQSNASDTQPLLASSDIIRALSQPTEAGLASSTGGGSSAEFTGHSNPVMINRDIPGHARHASFWRSQSCAPKLSTSTTMAEASALSILKDTDLAYPMPQKPAYGAPRLFNASNAFAGSSIWADSSHEFQPLSVGSDVTADYKSGQNSTEVDCNAAVPFLLRTASPAEQPQALFSSDVLGVHSFSGVGAPPTLHRSLVDPIGAPARRHRGPSFGALSTRSHDHLPLSESIQHLDQNSSLPQSTGSRSCRTSMDHKIVSSPPTDKSLFQRRSFWEQDSADLHK